MKLATYNINGIRSRIARLREWLEREQPDIVCLQELKAPDAMFPQREIEASGYGACWMGQASWNGVAILARGCTPVELRRGLPDATGDNHSRYIEAAVYGLRVGCLYLPNGNPQPGPKFDYKLAWFERLIAYAAPLASSAEPFVFAGDFNVVPTDDDIYNPKSWRKDALLQPQTRACYARLLQQGWVDVLRHCHPHQRIYTFWDYFRQHWPRNAGLRIDHILLNAAAAPRLRDAGVDSWVRGEPSASDHAPTWVELAPAGVKTSKANASRGAKSPRKTPRKKSGTRIG